MFGEQRWGRFVHPTKNAKICKYIKKIINNPIDSKTFMIMDYCDFNDGYESPNSFYVNTILSVFF